jgi:hypothetical protein
VALFGGFADGAELQCGYLPLSDRPGIGFEGQSALYSNHARACGVTKGRRENENGRMLSASRQAKFLASART